MFTDRFIKVPIKIFNEKDKEIAGVETCVDSYLMFNPFDLSGYYKSFDDDLPGEECVSITLKSGYVTMVYLSVKEFENLLNKHDRNI